MTHETGGLAQIDAGVLDPVVRGVLGDESARVANFTFSPFGHSLDGVYGTAPSIYRFSGEAACGDRTLPWSCVLKIVTTPATPHDPASPLNGAREPNAYASGWLDGISGVRAPRCYGVAERPGGGWWLWLEQLSDDIGREWPRDRYLLAARHLGCFNGATAAASPSHAWLSRSPLREAVAAFAPAAARLGQARDNPFVAHAIDAASAGALLRLIDTIEPRLAALDSLPQVICHWDAHRANLVSVNRADGAVETVLLDWANAGWGAAGAELSKMMSQTVNFFGVQPGDLAALDAELFAHYVDGLREAGWTGDVAAVRFGHTASSAARLIVRTASALHLALDATARAGFERATGRAFSDLASSFKATLPYYLSLADESARSAGR